jgi:Zn-dependent peptidase ImmA (M78 family)
MGAGICDSQVYTSIPSATFHNRRIGLKEEIQANKFAARLLMPEALIRAHQDKGATDPATLANLFGVSEATMKIRLGAIPPR